MIQKNLEKEIYSSISKTGKDVGLIVMHPKTWLDLCQDVFANESNAIYSHDVSLKYKGIRVLRSLDMSFGDFEVMTDSKKDSNHGHSFQRRRAF